MVFRKRSVYRMLFIILMSTNTFVLAAQDNRTTEKDGWIDNWPIPALIPNNSPFFLSLAVNGGVAKAGGPSQTFYLQSDIQKTYTADNPNSGIVEGEVFVGGKTQLTSHVEAQFGIDGLVSSTAKFTGDIWEDADPDFDNYTYSFRGNHAHVAIKGKLIADMDLALQPYLSASAGVGFNRAGSFSISSKIFEEIPAPAFTNDMQTSFVYTVGFGFQFPLNRHLQVGVGYEFSDWGNVQLNRATGQTLNKGIHMPHVYTNLAQLNVSFSG